MALAESSKRFSRRILAQAAIFTVAGLAARQTHAATDTWVGPYTDTNNTQGSSNWATASNWNIASGVAGQVVPYGGLTAALATDALIVNENDANPYQVNFDNLSLDGSTGAPSTGSYWFTSLTAGNAGVGSVNFNVIQGGYFATSGVLNFTSNASLNVGTDGGTQGSITSNGAVTFNNNSALNISGNSNFSTGAAVTFGAGSTFNLSVASAATAQTVTFGATSTLNVLSGSTFNTTAGAVFAGSTLGTQAILNVTTAGGSQSALNVGGGDSDFSIGKAGFATATIDAGSKLTDAGIESASSDDFFGGMVVGESSTAVTTGGVLNTAGNVTVTGRLSIGLINANHNGTGAAATGASTGKISMTGGTWTNGGNVLIGMDASSAGNGSATGALPTFGQAQGELDISGGAFTVATGKQVYVGASSATGVLNVSGGTLTAPSSAAIAGIQVGAAFDFLANTAGGGVDGIDGSIAGTGTLIVTGSGVVNTSSLTVGSSSSVLVSGSGALTATTITANLGSTITAAGGTLSLNSLIVNSGSNVNLSGGAVTFTGTAPSITLNGGGISVSGNYSAVALNLNASTNFAGISGGGTQAFGAVNFGGDTTITSTYAGSGNDVLSFTGINRPVGITGNFVTSGGTNGTTNNIVLTGQATGFISPGIYFGGGNYAWYDAGGFVRGINYGSDPGAVTTGATTSVSGTYVQTTGAVSAETTNTLTTLAINGANNFSLAGGATLTVNGIDKSGGGSTLISGGAGIQAANNAELIIRSDSTSDGLAISSPIVANGTNVLTKSGAGTLTLSGANTYTGGTIITDGTLIDGSSTGLPSTGSITINPGGTLDLNSQSATIGGLTLAGGAFANTGGGGSLSLNGDVISLTSPATFTSTISLTPATATGSVVRTFNVSGSNSVSDLTLSGQISKGGASAVTLLKTGSGTLTLSGSNSASSFNTLQVTKGTLRIDGSTGTLTDGLVNLTIGSPGSAAGAFKYDNTTSSGARTNAMGTLSFASGDGSVTSVQTAPQNVALTFSSISRTSGAAGNLVVTGGTNGTSNKINITGQAPGFIDPGIFFNGSNFAWEDAGGFVRGISYGTDPNSVSTGTSTAISPTAGTYLQVTAPLSAQSSTQLTGLMLYSANLVGSNSNISGGTHNTIQMINGFDKTGGGTASLTVSGTMTTLTPNSDIVMRTDTATDIITISWTIEGNGTNALVKSGLGTLNIGTNANLYTGDTIIDGGTLSLTSGNGSDLRNSTLNYNNFGGVFNFGANGTATLGGLKGSQNLGIVNTSGGAIAVTVGGSLDNQSNTYSGILSGPGSIIKAGTGTWTLAGANTYTGTTTIANGALELTSSGSLASPALNFTGAIGALILDAGQTGANFSAGTNLSSGTSASISASGITGTLALGALNRLAGSAIDFGVLPTGGSITTTTTNTAGTILGGWATVNQTGWATVSGGGTVGALASYSTAFTAGADVDAPSGSSTPGTQTINSLRFNNTGAITIADSGAGDTLTITSGGILETANIGANSVNINASKLTSGTSELIVDQSNMASGMGISSNISGAVGLTKTGAGTVTLSGSSTYTGPTTIVSGTLAIASDAAVHAGSGGFQFSSGTLQFNNYASSLVFTNLPSLKLSAATGSASTLSGAINGSSGLNYVGPGTLIVSGNNTYTGGTTVNAGTLKAGSTTALGNQSTYTLANAAGVTLDITGFNNSIGSLVGGGSLGGNVTLGSATLTIVGDQSSASYANSPVYAGVISGTGGLIKKAGSGGTYSAGVLTLTGANLYSGVTNLSGGVLAIPADTAVNSGAGGFVFAGGTLQFNNYTSNLTFNNLPALNLGSAQGLSSSTLTGAITGTSKLNYVGPGILTLAPSPSSANTYSGGTNLSAGTLAISADTAINSGTGGITFTAGTLQFNNYTSSLAFGTTANLKLGAATGTASKLGGALTGTSLLTYAGPGTLQLTSTANTYSGGTTIIGGTLQLLSNSTTLGSTTAALTVNPGGTLDLNGTSQTVNALAGTTGTGFILNNDTGTASTLTIGNGNTAGTFGGGIINNTSGTGTVALTKVGTAIETLSRADNTYTGITNVSAGTLTAGAAGAFSPNSEVLMANVSGATLNAASFADSIGSLTGGGTTGGNINLGTGVLTIGNDNTSPAAYAGVISSTSTAGGITKVGTGTLLLSGVNTYTGPTQVTGGTLEIAPAGALASTTAVTINATTGAAGLKYDTRTATGIQPITLASLNLIAGGTLTLSNTGSAATAGSVANHPNRIEFITSSLTNAGNVDLGGNDLIIHNSNTSNAAISLSSVNGQVASGFASGTWAGTTNGSIRSSAAAANTAHLTAIGVATGLTSFDGGTVLATDVLAKYTYFGDANLDGKIDGTDYSRIDSGYLTAATGWMNGDFNYDGVINGSDYTLIDNAFNSQGTSLAAEIASPSAVTSAEIAGSGATSSVPEPTVLGLLGIGVVGLLGRRGARGGRRHH